MAERNPHTKITRRQFIRAGLTVGGLTVGAAVLRQVGINIIPNIPANELPNQASIPTLQPGADTATPELPSTSIQQPILPSNLTPVPQEIISSITPIDLVLETPQHAALALQQAVDSVNGIESGPRKPGRYELGFIAGPSALRAVFVQNDGSHDPVTDPAKQLWSETEKQEQMNQLQIAADKWFQISKGNMPITIDAVVDGHTGYQADKMKQADQNVWLSEVMHSMGYDGDVFESVYQLDNDIRDKHNTLGATTVIFLKCDKPLTPDNFRSIAYIGGPFVIVRVHKDNGETWKIVRHELGHALVGLPDLYDFKPGTACDEEHGYFNKKYKSEESDAGHTKDGTQRPCTEAGTPDWMRSLDADTLGPSSQEAAGILDSDISNPYNTDAAGKLTVSVDTNVSSDGGTLQFSGHAHIEQEMPGNGGQSLELNTVKSIDVQSGSNQKPADPIDGTLDSDDETFSGSIPFNPNVSTSLIINSNIGGTQTIQIHERQTTSNDDRTYLPLFLR